MTMSPIFFCPLRYYVKVLLVDVLYVIAHSIGLGRADEAELSNIQITSKEKLILQSSSTKRAYMGKIAYSCFLQYIGRTGE